MSWRIIGFIKSERELPEEKPKEDSQLCFCNSGKKIEDCHELEHAWPVHERPDPD